MLRLIALSACIAALSTAAASAAPTGIDQAPSSDARADMGVGQIDPSAAAASLLVAQAGAGETAAITQGGDANRAAISQRGVGNLATIRQ